MSPINWIHTPLLPCTFIECIIDIANIRATATHLPFQCSPWKIVVHTTYSRTTNTWQSGTEITSQNNRLPLLGCDFSIILPYYCNRTVGLLFSNLWMHPWWQGCTYFANACDVTQYQHSLTLKPMPSVCDVAYASYKFRNTSLTNLGILHWQQGCVYLIITCSIAYIVWHIMSSRQGWYDSSHNFWWLDSSYLFES